MEGDGSTIRIARKDSSNKDQEWRFIYVSNYRFYIQHVQSSKFLGVEHVRHRKFVRDNIVFNDSLNFSNTQLWELSNEGQDDGSFFC